jgi:hypothetical protein
MPQAQPRAYFLFLNKVKAQPKGVLSALLQKKALL